MNGALLARSNPLRILIVGYPKAGKTGSLVSLLEMGYKIRMLDYDGNLDPVLNYASPEALERLDAVYLRDKLKIGPEGIAPLGKPTAFFEGYNLMDHWKYANPDGTETDLGHSSDWGCDTIVVLDSLTSHGEAAFLRWMNLLNKTPKTVSQGMWGKAIDEQERFIKRLTDKRNRHHVIVFSHLKMVGPKEIGDKEDDTNRAIKEQVAELLPTRLWPAVLGRALPQNIGGKFPIILEASVKTRGGKERRVFSAVPREEIDLGIPADIFDATHRELDIKDGLAYIFKKMAPPLSACASASTLKE